MPINLLKQFSQGELNENPDAVLQAVQYFMFSQKQGHKNLPFKVKLPKKNYLLQ